MAVMAEFPAVAVELSAVVVLKALAADQSATNALSILLDRPVAH